MLPLTRFDLMETSVLVQVTNEQAVSYLRVTIHIEQLNHRFLVRFTYNAHFVYVDGATLVHIHHVEHNAAALLLTLSKLQAWSG